MLLIEVEYTLNSRKICSYFINNIHKWFLLFSPNDKHFCYSKILLTVWNTFVLNNVKLFGKYSRKNPILFKILSERERLKSLHFFGGMGIGERNWEPK